MPNLPKGLYTCDPCQRIFPQSWKQAYFRMHFTDELGGYICPGCTKSFSGHEGFLQLEGDHIFPFSRGGLTRWDNFQLLCTQCHLKKGCQV